MANVPKIPAALSHRVMHLPQVVSVPFCIYKAAGYRQQWLISHPVLDADDDSLCDTSAPLVAWL
jgi:hypothetical protein